MGVFIFICLCKRYEEISKLTDTLEKEKDNGETSLKDTWFEKGFECGRE
jgi:hypothetical protein